MCTFHKKGHNQILALVIQYAKKVGVPNDCTPIAWSLMVLMPNNLEFPPQNSRITKIEGVLPNARQSKQSAFGFTPCLTKATLASIPAQEMSNGVLCFAHRFYHFWRAHTSKPILLASNISAHQCNFCIDKD